MKKYHPHFNIRVVVFLFKKSVYAEQSSESSDVGSYKEGLCHIESEEDNVQQKHEIQLYAVNVGEKHVF